MDENKEKEITCCKKFLVYFFLALNIFISVVILLLLFLSTYDVDLLDWYQYLYLVVATIVWLLLFCLYVGKLVLIIIGKLPSKYLRLAWTVLNGPAIVFFIIGFIFDIVMYSNGDINLILYNIIYWIVLVLFAVFTVFDFFHIKYQLILSGNHISEETQKFVNAGKVEVRSYQDGAESVNAKIKDK